MEDWENKVHTAFLLANKAVLEAHASRIAMFLSPLFSNFSYLPMTDFAAGPEYYAHVCNDIVINNKKVVVECGTGISTILFARLARVNNLDVRIYSLDHDSEWQATVRRTLDKDGVADCVEFVCSPIVPAYGHTWYDKSKLGLFSSLEIDTLVVDGPVGGRDDQLNRFGAIPFFGKYLSKRGYTVYLHDTERKAEQKTIEKWRELLPSATLVECNRYCVLSEHIHLDFKPQVKL